MAEALIQRQGKTSSHVLKLFAQKQIQSQCTQSTMRTMPGRMMRFLSLTCNEHATSFPSWSTLECVFDASKGKLVFNSTFLQQYSHLMHNYTFLPPISNLHSLTFGCKPEVDLCNVM